ncbi:MAG TPA: dihydrofolate reductase family protein [Trueperaceae bacterium]
MARLVYGMMQSLDGYVDDTEGNLVLPAPDDDLFRHFTEQVRGVSGCLYGRRIYDLLRYWDEDRPEYSDLEREYGQVWRSQPKWVVSNGRAPLGPNASLVEGDLESFVRRLKDEVGGDIDVAGPTLAGALTELDLIDEYRIYLRPFVLGEGKPYFLRARPALRLVGINRIGPETVQLVYVP